MPKSHILESPSVLGKTGQLFILALNPDSTSLVLPMMWNTYAAKPISKKPLLYEGYIYLFPWDFPTSVKEMEAEG